MASPRSSLYARHRRRLDVPLLLLASAGLLVAGYCLPFMEIKKFVFFGENYSLFHSIQGMWEEKFYLLAVIIVAFSIAFPIVKLLTLTVLWFLPIEADTLEHTLHWLAVLGKWSMLDVFVVAIIIVMTQASALVDARPRVGVYVFGGSVLLSMVATVMIDRIVKAGSRKPGR